MKALNNYLEENIDYLVDNVNLFMNKSDKEIEDFVGEYMIANNLAVSTVSGTPIVIAQPVSITSSNSLRRARKSYRGVVGESFEQSGHMEVMSEEISQPSAEEEGRKFAYRLQKAICTDKKLYDLLYDTDACDTLKNTIIGILPQLLVAMGVTGAITGTIWVAIIAAAIALILRVGYNMYCQVYWEKEGNPFEKK